MAREEFDELDEQPTSTPRKKPRRASFFGFLSTLTGLAAIAVVYRDPIRDWLQSRFIPVVNLDLAQLSQYLYQVGDYPVHAYHVAAAGAGLAVWALLWRKMLKRTRIGWPVLGLLLCASAAGIQRYHSVDRVPGTPEYWVQVNVVERVQKMFEKKPDAPTHIETSTASEPAAPAVTPDATAPFTRPAEPVTPPVKSAEPKTDDGSKLFPEL